MSFALLCPGQGGQTPGFLASRLREAPSLAQALTRETGLSLDQIDALSAEDLRVNALAQPCLAAYQMATWAALSPLIPVPALAMGYSLGEVMALALAGLCAPEAAIALAGVRARLMDAACPEPCAMRAVRGLGDKAVERLAHQADWHVAIRNGEDRFVVAGPVATAGKLEQAALGAGASVTGVGVTTPSHTPLLASAVTPFLTALEARMVADPAFPVISALDGILQRKGNTARARLARQLAEPLDWAEAMDALAERGIRHCLELGPAADLTRMLRDRHPGIEVRSVSEFTSLEAAAQWLNQRLAGGAR